MSNSRSSVSENQASASESESDRHALVGKQRGSSSQNKPLQSNQLSDDPHSPNQKYAIRLILFKTYEYFLLLLILCKIKHFIFVSFIKYSTVAFL